jgi:hypothetical protein
MCELIAISRTEQAYWSVEPLLVAAGEPNFPRVGDMLDI